MQKLINLKLLKKILNNKFNTVVILAFKLGTPPDYFTSCLTTL